MGSNSSDLTPNVSIIGKLVRNGFFPENGKQIHSNYNPSTRVGLLNRLNAKSLTIRTRDNIKLDSIYAPPSHVSIFQEISLVIICHGNGDCLEDFEWLAKWYQNHMKMGVLLFTLRGYYGSEGNIVDSGELGLYADLEAVVTYAINQLKCSRNRLLIHGFSLGGSLAAAGALFYNLHITLSHTFTSAEAVTATLVNSFSGGILPEMIGSSLSSNAFPEGLSLNSFLSTTHATTEPPLVPVEPIVSDGLNTLNKLKKLQTRAANLYLQSDLSELKYDSFNETIKPPSQYSGSVSVSQTQVHSSNELLEKVQDEELQQTNKEFIIPSLHVPSLFVMYSECDELMPISFAQELLDARYGSERKDLDVSDYDHKASSRANHLSNLAMLPGGTHLSRFTHYPEIVIRYREHLNRIGLGNNL